MKKIIISLLVIAGFCGSSPGSEDVTVAEYANGSTCAVVFDIDDYWDANVVNFLQAVDVAWSNHVLTTIAVITGPTGQAAWDSLQDYIDDGKISISPHNETTVNPTTWTESDYPEIIAEVENSQQDVIDNMTLPSWTTYNGTEFVTGWIQPWGTAYNPDIEIDFQPFIRDVLSTNSFLCDRSTTGAADTEYKNWDVNVGDKGLYERLNASGISTNYWNRELYTNMFDNVYATGGVLHFYHHPANRPVTPSDPTGSIVYDILPYVGNRKDVWYAGNDQLYLYRYLATRGGLNISAVETLNDCTIDVSCSGAERSKYGLSYPLTYIYTNETSVATSSLGVYYKGEGQPSHTKLPKLGASYYTPINTWRSDGDVLYISAAMPQVGTSFELLVKEDQDPIPDFPENYRLFLNVPQP